MANTELSSLRTHATALGGEILNISMDFSRRHEIAVYGQTIAPSPVPTIQVLQDGLVTTDFTVSGIQLDATKTQVIFTLTNVSADRPGTYMLLSTITLTGGQRLIEGLAVEVLEPSGGMLVKCL